MNPDNNPYPNNYLDTIAVQPQVKTMSPVLLWTVIGGVLVFAVVVLLLVLNGGSSSTDSLTRFGARMNSLQAISEDSQENLKSSDLRTLNSNLTLVLTNANRDLKEPFTTLGIKPENKKLATVTEVAAETAELNGRLEDARLNAVFDRTYAREMSYYLKSLRMDIRHIYKSTKNTELKQALETTDSNLSPIVSGFSGFNEG